MSKIPKIIITKGHRKIEIQRKEDALIVWYEVLDSCRTKKTTHTHKQVEEMFSEML